MNLTRFFRRFCRAAKTPDAAAFLRTEKSASEAAAPGCGQRAWAARLVCSGVVASFLTMPPTSRGDDHVKVVLSSEVDPFSLTAPRSTYSNLIRPLGLTETGLVTFVEPKYTFSYPEIRYLYRATAAKVLTRAGPDYQPHGFIAEDVNPAGKVAVLGQPYEDANQFQDNLFFIIGSKASPIVVGGQLAADDGFFKSFGAPSLAANGAVAFQATTTFSGQGVFLSSGPVLRRIAKVGGDALNGGTYLSFGPSVAAGVLGKTPLVGFTAHTTGVTGYGLYLASPSTVKLVASGSHPDFRMNNAGQMVYEENNRIYLGDFSFPGAATAIISSGDPSPDGSTFSTLFTPSINDRGQVVFAAYTNSYPYRGIFLWTPGGISKVIAKEGQAFDGGTVQSLDGFYSGDPLEITNSGVVMFRASIQRTAATTLGLFLGNGDSLVKVIEVGDPLQGTTVADDSNYSSSPSVALPGLLPGHGSVNSHGQVAYRVLLTTGKAGIFLFTPALRWSAVTNGEWDTNANWTLGLHPSATQNVTIDPPTDLVVSGPSLNTQVLSLQLGGGTGLVHLRLRPKVLLGSKKGVTVAANGILEGTGTLVGGVTLQSGAKMALSLGGRVRGTSYDSLKVAGSLTLDGTLDVSLANGFVPVPGDSFDVLDFSTHHGSFATVNLPTLASPAFLWNTSSLYRDGKVSVVLQPSLQGAYGGLIQAATPDVATSGPITITVKGNGQVIATGQFGPKRFSFSGRLNELGEVSGPLYSKGPTLKLTLDLASAPGQITGAINTGGTTLANLTADLTPAYNPKTYPNPYAGLYTVAFPPDAAAPNPAKYPQGIGFGALTISPTGQAQFVGQLGDATPISAGGKITAHGELPVYLSLYHKTGFVLGKIALHGTTPNDAVDGTLHWSRPATAAPLYYDTIASSITVDGSGYVAPAFPAGPATFTITAGGIPSVTSKAVAIDAKGKVTTDPLDGLKLKLLPKGLFSGSFTGVGANGKTKAFLFKGAAIQKKHASQGVFPGLNQTGSVDLR